MPCFCECHRTNNQLFEDVKVIQMSFSQGKTQQHSSVLNPKALKSLLIKLAKRNNKLTDLTLKEIKKVISVIGYKNLIQPEEEVLADIPVNINIPISKFEGIELIESDFEDEEVSNNTSDIDVPSDNSTDQEYSNESTNESQSDSEDQYETENVNYCLKFVKDIGFEKVPFKDFEKDCSFNESNDDITDESDLENMTKEEFEDYSIKKDL